MNQLSGAHLEWLEGERHIDVELATRLGLYTGKWFKRGSVYEVRRDSSGPILAFPTIVGGTIVGEHYRRTDKKGFFQRKGSAQVLWNYECLGDPALESGLEPLVITEGQMDALAAMTSGLTFAVSMPSGSTDAKGRLPEDLDPLDRAEADRPNGRFGSLYHARAQLARVKRFVIATDNDPSGMRLGAELVRRLGPGRCCRVTEYPEGCKDLNDVLIRLGRARVYELVAKAKPCPTRGVYRLSDFAELGEPVTWDTGWEEFDGIARLSPGALIPVAGIPAHGKTRFVLNWLVRVARRHNIHMALSSFETPVKPTFRNNLRRVACADSDAWERLGEAERGRLDGWLEDTFVVIEHDDRDDNEPMSLDWFLDRAHDALVRYDCRGCLIDPWNEIEHQREGNESEAEYQNRALRKIKAFAKRFDIFMVIVAHPTKDIVQGGKIRRPTLYDISGSSAWKNKADLGLGVFRPDMTKNQVEIYTDKVKYEFLGKPGNAAFQYNGYLGRFEPLAML